MGLNILLTGVTGYVGSTLAPRLVGDGHTVRGFARDPSRARGLDIPVFFFQAEYGIRVIGVTGVQTCALPIYHYPSSLRVVIEPAVPARYYRRLGRGGLHGQKAFVRGFAKHEAETRVQYPSLLKPSYVDRSEKRRVGKEWRFVWSASPENKKHI